jgi:hypothetical protein
LDSFFAGLSADLLKPAARCFRVPKGRQGVNSSSGFQGCRAGGVPVCRVGKRVRTGYVRVRISPVCFRFVFSPSFIINNMASFVFGFVFSTGTHFQHFPGFVFGFVWVCFSVAIPFYQ